MSFLLQYVFTVSFNPPLWRGHPLPRQHFFIIQIRLLVRLFVVRLSHSSGTVRKIGDQLLPIRHVYTVYAHRFTVLFFRSRFSRTSVAMTGGIREQSS